MKFYQRIFFLTFFSIAAVHADDFTDILQDLAVQTACIGQYSATQAGGTWSEDPYDYYKPYLLAERFKKMSGNMTRTTTFYGVCFDYAEFAYWDIKSNENLYTRNGMRTGQFFLAGDNSIQTSLNFRFRVQMQTRQNFKTEFLLKLTETQATKM